MSTPLIGTPKELLEVISEYISPNDIENLACTSSHILTRIKSLTVRQNCNHCKDNSLRLAYGIKKNAPENCPCCERFCCQECIVPVTCADCSKPLACHGQKVDITCGRCQKGLCRTCSSMFSQCLWCSLEEVITGIIPVEWEPEDIMHNYDLFESDDEASLLHEENSTEQIIPTRRTHTIYLKPEPPSIDTIVWA